MNIQLASIADRILTLNPLIVIDYLDKETDPEKFCEIGYEYLCIEKALEISITNSNEFKIINYYDNKEAFVGNCNEVMAYVIAHEAAWECEMLIIEGNDECQSDVEKKVFKRAFLHQFSFYLKKHFGIDSK